MLTTYVKLLFARKFIGKKMVKELTEIPDLLDLLDEAESKDEESKLNKANLPVAQEVMGEKNTRLLLYEKDFFVDPNLIHAALFNWTEQIIFEKTVKFRHREVNIVGATKSQEQLKVEFKKLQNQADNDIKSIKQLNKQLPICGDLEARMYFAILKIFYQQSINGVIPRKIITTYQEIKSIMGLAATSPTSDLKDSLFRLAHTRYDFKDSFYVRGKESDVSFKQTHSLYLLNYYELEVANLKEKINSDEIIEDKEIIEDTLKSIFNRRGKPTSILLKIILDEEVWKNLSNGYNLLYSYEHFKQIPKSMARGLYLFLEPNQGVLFTSNRIVKTNIPNIFTVKAQYLVEYLGSSQTNPSKSLGRINKALDLLKNEGYIKNYNFINSARKVLDGVYEIEFYPEQSRINSNKYSTFMVKAKNKALSVPMVSKSNIDIDFENIMDKFYLMVGGEELLSTVNKATLRTIYYDENNINIAKYMDLELNHSYGYYYLKGILVGTTSVKARDINALIKGIINAENSGSTTKTGYKNHALELMKKDCIVKYGEEEVNQLADKTVEQVQRELNLNSELAIDLNSSESGQLWLELIEMYQFLYGELRKEKIAEFNAVSRKKLIKEFRSDKFYAICLLRYVLSKAKDINSYLSKDGYQGKYYVSKEDALITQKAYDEKVKEKDRIKQNEELKNQANSQKSKEIEERLYIWQKEYSVLSALEKEEINNKAIFLKKDKNFALVDLDKLNLYVYALRKDKNNIDYIPSDIKIIFSITRYSISND